MKLEAPPATPGTGPNGPVLDQMLALLRDYALCREAENLSPRSIEFTVTAVKRFHDFLIAFDMPADPAAVTPNTLRAYILYLRHQTAYAGHPFVPCQNRPLSDGSIHNYIRGLSPFFTWLTVENILPANPFDHVKIPRAGAKTITPLSPADLQKLFAVIRLDTPVGGRDFLIILLFLDCGLRLSELIGLKLADVHLDDQYLKIRGKGNKERSVPFGQEVKKYLQHYIRRLRPRPGTEGVADLLFLNNKGDALTDTMVQNRLKRYGKLAGISGIRVSPHTFRHTAAISFLRNSGDVFSLQKMLGHNTLDMTRRYCAVANEDLRRAHRQASPVDNLGLGR